MQHILIVIPCLNEEAHIETLVLQLLRDCAALPVHIVIADGGSADRTPQLAQTLAAQHAGVHYLPNPKRLQSAGVNLAVATYGQSAEFLIRLDAHAGYPDDFCARLIEEAQLTRADAVAVSMDTRGNAPFQRAAAAAQNSRLGNGGSAHRSARAAGKWVDHGHHALIRIHAFNAVGGYDETFTHNEDAEFDVRLGRAHFDIWLTAKTRMTYYPRASPVALFTQFYHYGRGRIRTLLKHRVRPKLRQMLPVAVAPACVLALLSPACWFLAAPFSCWAILCLGYGAWIGIKAGSPGLIAAGPAAMIMHFAWSLGFWRGALSQKP